jgi:hypothetical protein
MRELIDEQPKDVLQYIEEQGVLKVCEFEVQVGAVSKGAVGVLKVCVFESAGGCSVKRGSWGAESVRV